MDRRPDTDNGAYGLYPVQCRNVLIEDSSCIGAPDAGIYVGQSHHIIVRGNRVENNVAGIEIENSTDADVYGQHRAQQHRRHPGLQSARPAGARRPRTRVFDNQSREQHTELRPRRQHRRGVPTGTGLMVLANDQVEIFGNTFRDNDTSHITVIGYGTAEVFGGFKSDNPRLDRYSESDLHPRQHVRGRRRRARRDLADLLTNLNGGLPLPNIIFDGDRTRTSSSTANCPRTCASASRRTMRRS